MNAKIYLPTSKKKTKKGYNLKIQLTINGKRIQKKTPYYSTIENWNFNTQEPLPSHPEFNIIYPKILNLKSNVRKAALEATSIDHFFELLNVKSKIINTKIKNPTFLHFANQLIREKSIQKKDSTVQLYQLSVYHLQQSNLISKHTQLKEIDYNIIVLFKNYLKAHRKEKNNKPLSSNTIHIYLRNLRSIMYEAGRRYKFETQSIFDGIFKDITIKKSRNKKKYINELSIKKLEYKTFTGQKEIARKLFLLSYYTGGTDLIDLINIKNTEYFNDCIHFYRAKQENKGYLVQIPILKKTKQIALELQGNNNWLYIKEKYKYYNTFRRNMYGALSDIQKILQIEILPFGGKLAMKVARHTFANIAMKKNIPSEIRRTLQGHERTDIGAAYEDSYPIDTLKKYLSKIVQ